MSVEAYLDWGAGQPAILGWEEMGLHDITVVCYIFKRFGSNLTLKQAEIDNDRILVYA